MDVHDLVCALKQIALELGRVPNRQEFCDRVPGAHHKLQSTGGFSALLQAAGLPVNIKRKKIGNEIFQVKNLPGFLLDQPEWKPLPMAPPTPFGQYPSIMSISDLHWPFVHTRLLNAFLDRVGEVLPSYIFINGDAWDMYSHAKFPRTHNLFTPREEEALAHQMNEDFWASVRKVSPKSKCIQLMGNHDIRAMKRVLENYPEAEDWLKDRMNKLFTFDGVQTIFDPREEYLIGNIAVFHGYLSQLGAHRDYTLYNTINGHTHKGGTVFRQIRSQVLWELNSGLGGNPLAKGLTYTPQKISGWTNGWGEVDAHGPRFVAFG